MNCCDSFSGQTFFLGAKCKSMKRKAHPLDDPGQQLFWKITLTILCAIVGVILALYLFRKI
jgi:hypothetical protein